MKNFYSLEFPIKNFNIAFDYVSPEILTTCAIIYALSVSISHEWPSIFISAILPLILIFKNRISLTKINFMNTILILTTALTWPNFFEGFIFGIKLALRVNMIYIVFAILIFPFGLKAVYSLPLPEKLRVLLILTLRGIFILQEGFSTAIISVKLRAPNLKGVMKFKVFAYMIGSVLLKAASKSEKIFFAVQTRGGFQGFNQSENKNFNMKDFLLLILSVSYAFAIIIMNYA